MLIILTNLALYTFIGYIVFILIRYGIIPSISDSYYYLEADKKGSGLYFSVWCSLVTLFSISPSLGASNTWYEQLSSLLMCIGLIIVSAAPAFKKARHNTYHIIGAILAAANALFLVCLWGSFIFAIVASIIAIIACRITPKKDVVLWLEVVCFSLYFSTLLYTLIT